MFVPRFHLRHAVCLFSFIIISHCLISSATRLDFTSTAAENGLSFSLGSLAKDSPTFPLKGTDKRRRYLVLHLYNLGLANRLRTVADFYTIAVYSGRTLLLSWQPSFDCNTTFTDLFSSGPEHFKVLPTILPRDPADE